MPKIVVIGKEHVEGVSKKTQKPFNFNLVHYNGKKRGVDGIAALTATLDPIAFPIDSIKVGGSYFLDFDGRGYVDSFEHA